MQLKAQSFENIITIKKRGNIWILFHNTPQGVICTYKITPGKWENSTTSALKGLWADNRIHTNMLAKALGFISSKGEILKNPIGGKISRLIKKGELAPRGSSNKKLPKPVTYLSELGDTDVVCKTYVLDITNDYFKRSSTTICNWKTENPHNEQSFLRCVAETVRTKECCPRHPSSSWVDLTPDIQNSCSATLLISQLG